jgi:MerR family transcriptional regulator, thiopeptide resistance regulator
MGAEGSMAWSTQQLADLAGTTVKAIRHYHRVGLLAEPERADNGYKQYRTPHLVRVLQIRRMTELGASLAQIAELDAPDADSDAAIDQLDADLAATIERLTRVRAELAVLRSHPEPFAVPAGFAGTPTRMSEKERSLVTVFSALLADDARADLRESMAERTAEDDELDALPADADDAAIADLAARLVPQILRSQARFPWLEVPAAGSHLEDEVVERTMGAVIGDVYNRAQLLVMLAAAQEAERLRESGQPFGT